MRKAEVPEVPEAQSVLSLSYRGGDKTIRRRGVGTGAEALNGPPDEDSTQPRLVLEHTWAATPPSGQKKTPTRTPGPAAGPWDPPRFKLSSPSHSIVLSSSPLLNPDYFMDILFFPDSLRS